MLLSFSSQAAACGESPPETIFGGNVGENEPCRQTCNCAAMTNNKKYMPSCRLVWGRSMLCIPLQANALFWSGARTSKTGQPCSAAFGSEQQRCRCDCGVCGCLVVPCRAQCNANGPLW